MNKAGITEVEMEKNGLFPLTDEDLSLFEKGLVSERVKNTFGFSYSVLSEVIFNKQYEKVN